MAAMMPDTNNLSSSSTTVVQHTEHHGAEQVATEVVRLKLTKQSQSQKKVSWTQETVDNEHMGKKKSKCCCVYVKPRAFNESDSDSSDGECDNCSGHVEKKRGEVPAPSADADGEADQGGEGSAAVS